MTITITIPACVNHQTPGAISKRHLGVVFTLDIIISRADPLKEKTHGLNIVHFVFRSDPVLGFAVCEKFSYGGGEGHGGLIVSNNNLNGYCVVQ
jgi:hypothetical protein